MTLALEKFLTIKNSELNQAKKYGLKTLTSILENTIKNLQSKGQLKLEL